MATNAIEMAVDQTQTLGTLDQNVVGKPALERGNDSTHSAKGFALAPLVDKIAYGIARGLVVAIRELEEHIVSETRKVGDAVDRRLDALQTSMQGLTRFVAEQQSLNGSVQGQLETLSAGLRDTDARQTGAVETLRRETAAFALSASDRIEAAVAAQRESDVRRETDMAELANSLLERFERVCKELGVQQEDVAAIKTALATFSTRTDALVQRLDRQAEAVRSMYASYSQRESELKQLVTGLARLRAFPAPMPANGL
jgi:chromosome segregation ATPase